MKNTWLNALGHSAASGILATLDALDWIAANWWNVAMAALAVALLYFGIRFHAEIIVGAAAYFATPAGFAMLVNLAYLAIGLAVLRLLVFWMNHSSVTGEKFDIHNAFDKVFEDANATARLLGLCAIAFAVLVHGFIGG